MSATTTETTAETMEIPAKLVLDRKHLLQGEKVVWESRPAWIIVMLRPLLMMIVAVIFAAVVLTYNGSLVNLVAALILAALLTPLDRRFGIPAAIAGVAVAILVSLDRSLAALVFIPLVLGLIPLLTTYMYWKHTAFAITDRRIISQYGFLSLLYNDTGLDRVQNISLSQPMLDRLFGFGDIAIVTSGELGHAVRRQPGIRFHSSGGVVWENVPKPFDVQRMLSGYVYQPMTPRPS
ncbi:MAG: PH domain-containing protein [Methanomassiliicoccus sp.]|nr:PH domain-containing protein [Methanomassiliicoccus sp.]